jgi:hypothetical protein
MKTPDSSDVIQGDEHCRDVHYRAKLDLRKKYCHRRAGWKPLSQVQWRARAGIWFRAA